MKWDGISQFEGPEQSPGFLLWQVSTKWRRQIEAALSTLGLTHPQFVILACVGWLTRGNQSITQIELANHCGTDINMTSQVLRLLEKKGYLERKKREGDERSKHPHLTKKGAALVRKAIPLVEKVDKEFFDKLGEKVDPFVSMLQNLSS